MNDQDFVNELKNAVRDGLRKAVADKLAGYNSPLDKMLAEVVNEKGGAIRGLLVDAISSSLDNAEWRNNIAMAVRGKLAQVLIQRFGGELEKQVNALKSDPATRARIVLAIENIVSGATT